MRNAASNWLVTCEVKFKVSKMDIIKIICATIRDGEACAYLTDDHGVRSHPGRDGGRGRRGGVARPRGRASASGDRRFYVSRRATGSINPDAPAVRREAEEDWGQGGE
jgi:hypothetical protein